jgi:archaellum component FlaC
MAKTLEERVKDLETRVSNLAGAIIVLKKGILDITKIVVRQAESQSEFIQKVNEGEMKMTKALNNLGESLLFASIKGHKPS